MAPLAVAESGLTSLLFENPWPGVVALVAVSAVLRVAGKRQGNKGVLIASWVALLLGLGVYAAASWVNTDREVMIQRTEAWIQAASPVDRAALTALMAPNVPLLGPQGDYLLDLDAPTIAQNLEQYRVEVVSYRDIEAWPASPGQGTSHLRVSHEVLGQRVLGTSWELGWRRNDAGDWRVVSIKWVRYGNEPPSDGLLRRVRP